MEEVLEYSAMYDKRNGLKLTLEYLFALTMMKHEGCDNSNWCTLLYHIA